MKVDYRGFEIDVWRELVSTPLCFGEHPVMPNRMTQED